jgi:hypothetical protein
MIYTLKKIWVDSSAKVGFWFGLFWAIVNIFLIIVLIILQALLLVSVINKLFGGGMAHNIALPMGMMSGVIIIFLAPLFVILCVIATVINFLLLSALYNLSAKIIGGFKLNLNRL